MALRTLGPGLRAGDLRLVDGSLILLSGFVEALFSAVVGSYES